MSWADEGVFASRNPQTGTWVVDVCGEHVGVKSALSEDDAIDKAMDILCARDERRIAAHEYERRCAECGPW